MSFFGHPAEGVDGRGHLPTSGSPTRWTAETEGRGELRAVHAERAERASGTPKSPRCPALEPIWIVFVNIFSGMNYNGLHSQNDGI